ncbi:MAG: hypothetical protein K0S23_683 [Fluviicola sp.]|jgi:hypothetical protein|nr:hypothetical protein [Fluviicola sp.]
MFESPVVFTGDFLFLEKWYLKDGKLANRRIG